MLTEQLDVREGLQAWLMLSTINDSLVAVLLLLLLLLVSVVWAGTMPRVPYLLWWRGRMEKDNKVILA